MATEELMAARSTVAEERVGYAGFGARLGAFVLDLLLTALWALPFRSLWRQALSDPAVLGNVRASGVAVLLIAWTYFVVTTALTGGTLGKHAAGLRVVGTDLGRPGWVTILFREVVGRIIVTASLGIGYLWAAFDPRKQGWHDRIADTLVLRRVVVLRPATGKK
ncbi:MAG TPA: RDD family protein [Actinomycetota bacterium]|nr:RDD family protein [Actinomycetota bacterium]